MRDREARQPSHKKSFPEFPHTMEECTYLSVKLERELHKLMHVVRGDADMHKEWEAA